MMTETTKTVLKTAAITAAVFLAFAMIFGIQIATQSGPAGAMIRLTGGTPEWFAAARRWNLIESYGVWPLLVIIGAALQRFWCSRAAFWTAAFVALPAAVAQFTTDWPDLLISPGYVVLALLTGLTVSSARRRHAIN